MSALVYVVAFCVVAVGVYAARYSGRLRVGATRVIDAPAEDVRAWVAELSRWREWNPWLVEADMVEIENGSSNGPVCVWRRAGAESGRVTAVRGRDGAPLEQRLRLNRPFPFRARAAWRFDDAGGKTAVSWSLRGRVGFSMRAFAPTVQGSIALDFRHGLDRLAALVEPAGAPRYAVSFPGVREIAAMRYAYVGHEGPIDGLAAAIDGSVDVVRSALLRHGLAPIGVPLGVYVRTDIKRRTTLVHFGLPVDTSDVEGLALASRPAHRALTARLQGSRTQLEVAWYLAMQRLSAEGLQPDLRIAPFERYLADATDGSGNDAVTELHIAVR